MLGEEYWCGLEEKKDLLKVSQWRKLVQDAFLLDLDGSPERWALAGGK